MNYKERHSCTMYLDSSMITFYMIILWCMWLIRLFLYNRCDLAIFKIEAMPLLFRFQTRAFKHLRMTPDSLGAKKSKHQLPPPNTTGGSSHDGFLIMVINPQVPETWVACGVRQLQNWGLESLAASSNKWGVIQCF